MGSKTTNGSLSLSLIIRSFDSASSRTSVHPILMKGVYSGNLTQHCFDCSVTGTLHLAQMFSLTQGGTGLSLRVKAHFDLTKHIFKIKNS